jgi:hypothetical protein
MSPHASCTTTGIRFSYAGAHTPAPPKVQETVLDDGGEDHWQYVLEITGDVLTELAERLEDEINAVDHLAVATAVQKAAWRGFTRGVANLAYMVNARWSTIVPDLAVYLPPDVELPDVIAIPTLVEPGGQAERDLWAETWAETRRRVRPDEDVG